MVNVNGEFTEKVLKTFSTMTPALPKSPWCNVTLAGVVCVPTVCGALLRTRRPPLLLFSQAASFLLNRSGGRGVPSK